MGYNNKIMRIGFVLFEAYHQRKNIGSSRIRGHWIIEELIKLGHDAESFVQGADYDVVVYQKCYWKEHMRVFKGLKILDICDPDWLEGSEIVSILKEVDIVTVSSEKLKEDLQKFTSKTIHFIPDGVKKKDKVRKHKGRAKKICWFGYSNNLSLIEPTLMKIKKLGLKLRIISDGSLNTSICDVENIKWDIETVEENIRECDMCLLPDGLMGRFIYKSQNKTYESWSLGLPVVKTPDDLERFMDEEERIKESEKRLKEVEEKYLVKHSAKKLMEIIEKEKVK